MLNVLPQICRTCDRTSRDVRFASKHECAGCASFRKAQRAQRLLERGRLTADAVRPPDPDRNPRHLTWVRSFPCAVGRDCSGVMHAHHVRTAATAGMGMKPPDRDTVPLCGKHHDEIHWTGEDTFGAKYEVDLAAIAARLARGSPHLKQRERA